MKVGEISSNPHIKKFYTTFPPVDHNGEPHSILVEMDKLLGQKDPLAKYNFSTMDIDAIAQAINPTGTAPREAANPGKYAALHEAMLALVENYNVYLKADGKPTVDPKEGLKIIDYFLAAKKAQSRELLPYWRNPSIRPEHYYNPDVYKGVYKRLKQRGKEISEDIPKEPPYSGSEGSYMSYRLYREHDEHRPFNPYTGQSYGFAWTAVRAKPPLGDMRLSDPYVSSFLSDMRDLTPELAEKWAETLAPSYFHALPVRLKSNKFPPRVNGILGDPYRKHEISDMPRLNGVTLTDDCGSADPTGINGVKNCKLPLHKPDQPAPSTSL